MPYFRLQELIVIFLAFLVFSTSSAVGISEDDFIDLIYAVRLGDAEGVIAGLDKGIPVNQIDGDYYTLMWHAISAEQPEIMELLVGRGYDWDERSDGRSPIVDDFGAALQSNLEILQMYIHGSSDSLKKFIANNPYWRPWAEYISRAEPELLEYCAESGLLPQIQSMYAMNLKQAIIDHNHEMVDFLLRKNWGRIPPTVVAVAVYYGNEIALDKLIERGLRLDQGMSPGVSLSGKRFELGSPLVAAVTAHNLPIVERLLEAGVDPGANDNVAILWADALGNKAIYDRLLSAGAEEPKPFAFFDHEPFTYLLSASSENLSVDHDNYSWELGSILNSLQSESSDPVMPPDGSAIKVGIISLSEGLEDSAILLEAALSKAPGVTLVDRSQLRILMRERSLQAEHGSEAAFELGSLTGADAILYLRKLDSSIEARIVSTETGLVLSTYFYTGKVDIDLWAEQVVQKGLLRNEVRLRMTGEDALLVSIPRIGTTGSSGLESLADQLAVLLGYRLGKEPNIFLLDRNELERLTLEQGLAQKTSEFFRSAWVIDGFMDRAEDPQQLALEIRLQRGQGGEEERIVLKADVDNPLPMVEAIVATLLDRDVAPSDSSANDAEGRLFFERGMEAHRAGLFGYALASFRTASALGYEKKDLWDATIRSSIRSLIDVRNQLVTINNLEINLSYLEYLSWPAHSLSRHAYNSEVEDLIDIANLLLDQVEICLQTNRTITKGDINDLSYLPYAFYNANSVLELLTPLSNRKHHGPQISALKNRLESLSGAAIDWSGQNDLRVLQGELLIMRFTSIPYWTDDEVEAMREMDQVFDKIHQPELEAVLCPFFNELEDLYGKSARRARAAYAITFWYRYLEKMRESDYPKVRLLAYQVERNNLNINRPFLFQSPELQMEEWRSLQSAVEADFRERKFAGDFGHFALEMPSRDPLELGSTGRDIFTMGAHTIDKFPTRSNRTRPPLKATFSMARQIQPAGQRFASDFKLGLHLLPEIAIDESGLERDEWVYSSRLQRLAEHWQKIEPAREARKSRFFPHQLVPEMQVRAFPLGSLLAWKDEAEGIYSEIKRSGLDESEWSLLFRPLLDPEYSSADRSGLVFSVQEEIQRREANLQPDDLGPSPFPVFDDKTFFITAKELANEISDPRNFDGWANSFSFRDGSYWLGLLKFGILQLDSKSELVNVFRYPEKLLGKNGGSFLHVSPQYVLATLREIGGPESKDLVWYAILDRHQGTWKVLEYEGLPRSEAIQAEHLVYSMHVDMKRTASKGGGSVSVGSSGYYILKYHNLLTGEERVLADTRRVPPMSPLDQGSGSLPLYQIEPLGDGEFLIDRKQIIDFKTGSWRRPRPKEKSAALVYFRDTYRSLERFQFRGVNYAVPRFRSTRTQNTSESVIEEHQQLRPTFTFGHELEIPWRVVPESIETFSEEWRRVNSWIEHKNLSTANFFISNNGAILANTPVGFTIYTPEEVEKIMEHAWDQRFPAAEPSE